MTADRKLKNGLFILLTILCYCTATAQIKKPHVNHIAFSVTDLARSAIFYRDVIGLDTVPEPFHDGRHVWLAIGDNSFLHLIQNPGPAVVPGKNTHLCFSVSDVNALVSILQKNKILYEDWPGKQSAITTRVDGVHQIYLKDPDGYWIEINDDTR